MGTVREMNDRNLDDQAGQGFDPECECAYLPTSPSWYAFQLGRYLQNTGRSRPANVRMSRGYTIRCNDMLFKHIDADKFERLT